MDIRKIVRAGAAFMMCCTAFGLGACSKGSSGMMKVDKAIVDSLNTQVDVFTKATQEQREMLFKIMTELDEVANSAFELGEERQLNGKVKNGRMLEQITIKLASIKNEIADAEQKMTDNPSLKETIEKLKAKTTAQEKYIQNLRKEIAVKKSTLKERYEELGKIKTDLSNKIEENKEASIRLENENNKLSEAIRSSWTSAGEKLEVSADEVQLLKESGPLARKTREAKKRILSRAKENYREAAKLGDASANQNISRVESKIQNLNN